MYRKSVKFSAMNLENSVLTWKSEKKNGVQVLGKCPFILLYLLWCQCPRISPRNEIKMPDFHDYEMIIEYVLRKES